MIDRVIRGEGFTIETSKFDYFFGRVISTPDNTRRSLQNRETLQLLGIDETTGGQEQLLKLFREGLTAPEAIENRKINEYGTTIVRKLEVTFNEREGAILICYFYADHDLSDLPKVTSIIPKIYRN